MDIYIVLHMTRKLVSSIIVHCWYFVLFAVGLYHVGCCYVVVGYYVVVG